MKFKEQSEQGINGQIVKSNTTKVGLNSKYSAESISTECKMILCHGWTINRTKYLQDARTIFFTISIKAFTNGEQYVLSLKMEVMFDLKMGIDLISNRLFEICMNMFRHQRLSSSLLWRIDSRIRLISFFPLCSPCLTFMFDMTLRHPASTFNLDNSSLLIAYFRRFYDARSLFYCSFFSL